MPNFNIKNAVPITPGKAGANSSSPSKFNIKNAIPIGSNNSPAGIAAGASDKPGSITQYADQSANPASTSSNPTPSWFQNLIAGKPLAPLKESDTEAFNPGYNPLVQAGKILANVFSDAPSVLAAIPQAILHPWNTAQGLSTSVGNIGAELGNALHAGLFNGDWSRMTTDLQDTEISAGNHPLQTVLLMDGALDTAKAISDKGVTGAAGDFADKTAASASKGIDQIKQVKGNIAKLFNSKTTLTEHTFDLEKQIDAGIALNKNLTGTQSTVEDFNAKNQALLDENKQLQTQLETGNKPEIQAKIDENNKKQAELSQQTLDAKKKLQVEQDKVNENFKQRTAEVNNETANQQKEFKLKNGFDSNMKSMGQAVSSFFTKAFDRASGVYDQTLGNAKIDLSDVFDSLDKYKKELLKGNKFKSADVAQREIDQLKIRDIMGRYAGDSKELYDELESEGINKKLYNRLTPEELQDRYMPLTSEYLKTAKNAIYNAIEKGADESSVKEYADSVIPAFDKVFGDAIKETYGAGRLEKIKENDANWSELKKNPLSKDASPSLDKIQDNWDSFVSAASKVQGGADLISRIQNFAAETILNNAEDTANPNTYSYKKILSGLDEYGGILDDTSKERLQRVADDNKAIADEKVQKTQEIQTQRKTLTQETVQKKLDLATEKSNIGKESSELKAQQKKLSVQQKDIETTGKKIGQDIPDIVKNIEKIDSNEKLQDFLDTTGVESGELGKVAVSNIFKAADVDIGLNRLDPVLDKNGNPVLDANGKQVLKAPNFDISKVKDALKEIRKLGGGDQDVQDKILGQTDEMKVSGQTSDTQKALLNLEDQVKEYDSLTTKKGQTIGKRLANIAVGTLMLTLVPIGKFFAMRRIYEGIRPEAAEVLDDARARTEQPLTKEERVAKKGKTAKSVVKRLQGSAATAVGVNQGNQENQQS